MCLERVNESIKFINSLNNTKIFFISHATDYKVAQNAFKKYLNKSNDISFFINPSSEIYDFIGSKYSITGTFTFTKIENLYGLLAFPIEFLKGRMPFINAGDPFQQGGQILLSLNDYKKCKYLNLETSPGYPKMDWNIINNIISENNNSINLSNESNNNNKLNNKKSTKKSKKQSNNNSTNFTIAGIVCVVCVLYSLYLYKKVS